MQKQTKEYSGSGQGTDEKTQVGGRSVTFFFENKGKEEGTEKKERHIHIHVHMPICEWYTHKPIYIHIYIHTCTYTYTPVHI